MRNALAFAALLRTAEYFLSAVQLNARNRAPVSGNAAMTAVCFIMAARVLWRRVHVTNAGIVVHWQLYRIGLGWDLVRAVDAGRHDTDGSARIPSRTDILTLPDTSTIALWSTTGQVGASACPGDLSRRWPHRLETAGRTVRSGG
jgi:hypothetical protein